MAPEPRPSDLGEVTFRACSGPRCTATVRWVLTEGGRRLPLDLDPHPDGNVVIRRVGDQIRAHVLTGAELPAQQTAWRAHFASCVDSADYHRRKHALTPKCRACGSAMDPWLPAHGWRHHINCAPLPLRDQIEAAPTATPAPGRAVEQLPGLDQQTWVVVGCGAEKLDHRAAAGEMYVGSYHRAARRAAAALAGPDRTLILSAKHGLLQLGDEIAPYDLRMTSPDAVPALMVSRQLRDLGVARPGTRVVILAGRDYAKVMKAAMRELNNPRRPDHVPMARGSMILDLPLQDTRGIGDQLAIFARLAQGGAA